MSATRRLDIRTLLPDPVACIGAPAFDARGSGLSPRRLPDWTRLQTPELMDVMVRMPSGVRLRLRTDSTRIGIEFLATNLVTPPDARRPIAFDLETGGRLQGRTSTAGDALVLDPAKAGAFELVRGEADTLWFDTDAQGDGTCELWLPHNAFVELRALHLDAGARLTAAAPDPRPRWVHYGSSISHCMEAEQPGLIWPAVAARLAGAELHNLGFGGQCHLDQFVARTMRDAQADLISIKTGINVINMDSMRERVYVPALHGFLDTLRERCPETPILLISPIFCPSAEDAPGPTLRGPAGKFITVPGHEEIRAGCMSLTRMRALIADVVARRRAAGDAHLHHLDGLALFGAADAGDLPDDLHPNPAGYVRMGERFAPTLGGLISGAP